MRFLAILPILTAALAVACAVRPAAHRLIWPTVALAAINVVLTPLTSGEWFYQRAEDPSYETAVARGDFASFDDLLSRHDPHLHPRMVGMSVALLLAVAVLGLLRSRAARGQGVPAVALTTATGAVLLAALVSIVQGVMLIA